MDNNDLLFKLIDNYKSIHEESDKVIDYKSPSELASIFDFKLGPKNEQSALNALINDYVKHSAKTGNKQYLNQLFSGFNSAGVAGEILATLMNTSMYTYEVAPVATLIEREVIAKMNSYTGFTNGDGIFTSGGSNSNMLAMLCARHKKHPEIKTKGLFGLKPLSLFVSELSHYSFQKGAYTLGVGTESTYYIETDDKGRIIPEKLEEAIKTSISKGETPFFVAATAGTTELGAFDPIEEMNAIAKKYDCWMHVDGSWGGSIILSKKHKHLFRGLEKADSFVWNAHKLMNAPLIASALLINDLDILYNSVSGAKTDYIFHEHENKIYDLGNKSLQCGRKNDALKVWFAWKAIGDAQYEKNIDALMELGKYTEALVINHPNLELLSPVQSLNINFRFAIEDKTQINDFNKSIRNKLIENGTTMVNYCHLKEDLSIRLTLVNQELTAADIDKFFTTFVAEGLKLKSSIKIQEA